MRENRFQYMYSMSHYRLSKQIKFKLQSEAFEGLSEMIDPKWIRYGSLLGFSSCASTSSDLCHFFLP
jgi:hypothetical protein